MIRDLLIKHEGLRLKPYKCSAGKWTIGYGRNLDDVGITEAEALYLLHNDIKRVTAEAVGMFPWFSRLTFPRQSVVLDMLFNLGLPKFLGFKRMIAAIERSDWSAASAEMIASRWYRQVGRRAEELAQMMRDG